MRFDGLLKDFYHGKTSNFKFNIYFGVWLSLVERFVRDEEAGSSNLLTPTKRTDGFGYLFFVLANRVGEDSNFTGRSQTQSVVCEANARQSLANLFTM